MLLVESEPRRNVIMSLVTDEYNVSKRIGVIPRILDISNEVHKSVMLLL